MDAHSREARPPTLVIGSVLALLYAVGSLIICLWILSLVFEDEGTRLSSGEQSGLVVACMGVAVTVFGIFCIIRGLQRQIWALTLVVIGLGVGVFVGIGVTVMAFKADEDGLLSSGWFWLAITLVMIAPVVLLSIAISKLPSRHESPTTDSR
ncbi:hypothetical protein ACFVJS_03225 [Nocardioides sp. NPDC057772]|uniref:hypothetical protein n=1 Tax=Nocardioides sp. NPDC057772 TaxID=3346245 RepID=UPI00366E687B